ncbi:MAG: PKD domain-containing protein [Bacteroidetes bacterium]|nr:PKD domain-containing protein [Bacteroidota bacterium]
MKKILHIVILLFFSSQAFATHISGGELFYEYMGAGAQPNTNRYKITMRLFRECNSNGASLNGEIVNIGIYYNSSSQLYTTLQLIQQWSGNPPVIQNTPGSIPCLIGSVNVCYQIGTFSSTIDLPNNNPEGFILSWVRYSRQEMTNIDDDPVSTRAVGATYITTIPGTNVMPSGFDNCPQFAVKDTGIVCAGKHFVLDFSAKDADGDSLSYSFIPSYDGGSNADPNPAPTQFLSLVRLPYLVPYSGIFPLGSEVYIDPKTGTISGDAPKVPGKYVVNVAATEWRNGVILNVHRKDFILTIGNCDFAAADLKPSYLTCDGFTLTFQNESTSSGIHTYLWDFGDPTSPNNTSTAPVATHTYSDTGTYTVKLVINKGEQCTDSTISNALVYPGFFPDFSASGSCVLNPYQFKDLTTTKYGVVDSWRWDFGDLTTLDDTSHIQNPSYPYSSPGTVHVQLIVTNSKGCAATIVKDVVINDLPSLTLPFHDTLICGKDSIQLISSSGNAGAVFTWTPNYNINNTGIANPIVFPLNTTTYHLSIEDKGCKNSDSVVVNVIDSVSLNAGKDTTICLTDGIQLQPQTNGLIYSWTPITGLDNPTILNPIATPLVNTTYTLTSNVGKCFAKDNITINVVPYPVANAGLDTAICFGKTVVLHANVIASSFSWTPVNTLVNPNTLNPTAGPQNTTQYYLTVYDTLGCPKPVIDTITVRVTPPVYTFAGNDTVIVAMQPLQLNATSVGGTIYTWNPTIGLSNPQIANPVATLPSTIDSVRYIVKASTPEGCVGYDDILVIVFKTQPDIFVPSAFTPNGDGLNDDIKPILIGMKELKYFQIFNRYGQLIFSTKEIAKGWDGTFKGVKQGSGTFVYQAEGIDYMGNTIRKKGTIVLIR